MEAEQGKNVCNMGVPQVDCEVSFDFGAGAMPNTQPGRRIR
jgi:hypothetical protein